ncbi:glycosyltransferase family 4 protein [Niveibacterium microcysteis]|uniref:Glycosyltransferase family 4 protein n=1 Tax=Niveibacterium microcysteis TaxID=2811415 RepID=A0ABX7MBB3_9RHOO|nr:glycosyltransferase family 4 protein [Niveibacterium microcysteis]QSI79029.1 glycosyltransferase family 4 protein [Niveibacterium microcysteis]
MQSIAWDLFREFAREGHEVTVLTTRIAGEPFGESTRDGVRVVALEGTTAERCDKAWWRLSATWFEANHQRFDAVLSISSAAASIAEKRALAPTMPFLFQAHGTSWGEIVSKWRTGRPLQWAKSMRNVYWLFKDALIYRRFDHVVLVGDVLANQFSSAPVAWYARGVPTRLIRNGIDTQRFRPDSAVRKQIRTELGWNEADRVVAFAARMHPQKGGESTLKAFAEMAADSHRRLLMIGDGEDLPRLRQLAATLGCADRVTFTGAVSRERVLALLAACDAFCFPSLRQEGLPMNVLEALACGLRPVCSDNMKDVFDSELPIAYAPPRDVHKIAAKLADALVHGCANASLLTPSYTLKHCASAYLDLLRGAR